MYVYVYTHRTCSKFKKASKIPSRTWQLLQVATVTCTCFCYFHVFSTSQPALCTSSASKTRSQTKTSNGILQETNSCLLQSCRPRVFPFHVYMVYVVYMAWFWETAAQLHDPNIRHQKTPNFVCARGSVSNLSKAMRCAAKGREVIAHVSLGRAIRDQLESSHGARTAVAGKDRSRRSRPSEIFRVKKIMWLHTTCVRLCCGFKPPKMPFNYQLGTTGHYVFRSIHRIYLGNAMTFSCEMTF